MNEKIHEQQKWSFFGISQRGRRVLNQMDFLTFHDSYVIFQYFPRKADISSFLKMFEENCECEGLQGTGLDAWFLANDNDHNNNINST